ncbi:MAG: extracellular solute-binding protein, partial [Chloroflexi bacterium]|nr:extracellular solute-binding protein [Chloroflexota bacterium]
MKRLLFVLLLIVALLLAACGGGEEATEAPEAPDAPAVQATEEDAPVDKPDATDGAELRFTYYADGNEAEVMQSLLDDFMAANPDITVVLDVVPYATIDEQLPIQVETGEGPDLARITNFGAYSGQLLDLRKHLGDEAFYKANFP